MSMLLDNLKDVEERIQAACYRSGRKREDVLLVAVSKTKPVEMIEEVMTAGIVDFGENNPQELRDKYEVLPKNLRFHMIGHLQTNKIKYVIDRVVLIHSIDSIHLAEAQPDHAGSGGSQCGSGGEQIRLSGGESRKCYP